MAEIQATRKELGAGFKLRIGEPITLKVVAALPRVRLTGMFFDLNKCFLLPSAMPGIQALGDKYQEHPGANLLIVGHTDTSGEDEPNLDLSLERADAMAAFLKEDTAPWEAFFGDDKPAEKRWGTREIQMMLSAVPSPEDGFYKDDVDGVQGEHTTKAIEDFQAANGLKVDGVAGPVTRQKLIAAYMDPDNRKSTKLPPDSTIATVGAGESFPADETGDGVRDPDNRRAEIFFFDGPIAPAPPPDSKARKGSSEYPAWLAQVTESDDFGPDDDGPGKLTIRLHDGNVAPLPNAAFRVSIGSEVRALSQADGNGLAEFDLPAFCPDSILIEWGPAGSSDPFPFRQDILVECDGGSDETQALAKLNNIGYPFQFGLDAAVRAFQADYNVDNQPAPLGLQGGSLPPATRKRLFDIYESLGLDASPAAA